MNNLKTLFVICILPITVTMVKAQGIALGETIFISNSSLKKDADPESFQAFMLQEMIPAWNRKTSGATMHLFQADRGDHNGEMLTACFVNRMEDRKDLQKGCPFSDKSVSALTGSLSKYPSAFLDYPDAYTEYQLIGVDGFTALPNIELLGIHYIKVKPKLGADFEKFVIAKLHPAVGHLVYDMNLLYYKAVAGQHKGSYITIFAIESVKARERFWPTGGPEQDIVKQLFTPYKKLAEELSEYLVEDSYLKPESGGGAAIFESLEWTDYALIGPR